MGLDFKVRKGILLVFLTMAAQSVLAAERSLTFVYSPDPANPASNSFVDTSAGPGYCPSGRRCVSGLGSPGASPITASHATRREGVMFKLPSEWRDVQVTDGVDVKTVKFRLAGFGARVNLPNVLTVTGSSSLAAAHDALWVGNNWKIYTNSACSTASRSYNDTTARFEFFWHAPGGSAAPAECGKISRFNISNVRYTGAVYSYEVQLPEPQSMASGVYQGSISYSFAPHGDIDYGDKLQYPDSVFTVNLNLTVNHMLVAKFPWGGHTLALRPEGGWMQWIQRGRRPEKLYIDQSFQFSTNNAFKMHLECQYPLGNRCGIQNGSGHQVPVETRVTLPAGINDASGQPVNRQVLSAVDKQVFTPTRMVTDSKASLHFEVGRDEVREMTDNHPGSKYSGNVTVVWDSDILAP